MRLNQLYNAKKLYTEVINRYQKLTVQEKKILYGDIQDLYKEIKP